MKLYILTTGDYDDYMILGVFSDQAKAEAAIQNIINDEIKKNNEIAKQKGYPPNSFVHSERNQYTIDEFILDELEKEPIYKRLGIYKLDKAAK